MIRRLRSEETLLGVGVTMWASVEEESVEAFCAALSKCGNVWLFLHRDASQDIDPQDLWGAAARTIGLSGVEFPDELIRTFGVMGFPPYVQQGPLPAWLKALHQILVHAEIDMHEFTNEVNSTFRAHVRALLPRYRQQQLECVIDLVDGRVSPSSASDFAPMGPRTFFASAVRLISQDLLARRGVKVPLVLVFDDSSIDWTLAFLKMLNATSGPVVTVFSHGLPKSVLAVVSKIDWDWLRYIRCFSLEVAADNRLAMKRIDGPVVW
ncbi:MAG: hypothetical protein H6944_10290 [Zoogloeaceae bacterium]|nr:hypothetical protein [Rhodocyclaceae bacterium]MCP5222060.1 hypothetical protein [Zoogloeaceae bacterium]